MSLEESQGPGAQVSPTTPQVAIPVQASTTATGESHREGVATDKPHAAQQTTNPGEAKTGSASEPVGTKMTKVDNVAATGGGSTSQPADPSPDSETASLQGQPRPDADTSAPKNTPALVVNVESDGGRQDMDDVITSPHGNNAIVERSPGGRYVRFMEKLGSGASKEVYRAYDTQEGIEVAWNVVHLAGVPKNERNRIVNEVKLLERLHHHNIISFHGSWVNREKQQVNFVTEILSSGTLQSFINKVQVIRWKIAKRWAVQILKGLEYLHSQDPPVIHRDLKCENIFINGTSGDLRIGDLGLSTVHRNGKALSVLGTPEFMAPDMYEEIAYDEKVDIYAFGMCLLEIFTKEIPYQECNNPAQIYKKVTRGDPPGSLKRLKSRHARAFIELCLGHKGEDGNYVRPSAADLLAHPFLQKRPNDEDEVEVDPPMQESTIKEGANESSSSVKGASRTKSTSREDGPHSSQSEGAKTNPSARTLLERRVNSLEEDESDQFEEMPDSETSARKPKVLMGRDQELVEEDDEPSNPVGERRESGTSKGDEEASKTSPVSQPTQTASPATMSNPQQSTNDSQDDASMHYLVAAAVIEHEQPNSRPYEDDILKLVVTLPVEGQTQNVQFDFHLVEDDPVQVAKEMVEELGIPQGAVLEISATISGLARAARVKQDKYLARTQQKQSSLSHSLPQNVVQQPRPDVVQQQHTIGQMGQAPAMLPSGSHQPMTEFLGSQQMHNQPVQQPVQQPGMGDQSVQAHAQQVGQHSSVPSIPMQPQHPSQQVNDGQPSLQMNQQMPGQHVNQVGSQGDPQFGQHQQNWNHQVGHNLPPANQGMGSISMNSGQQSYNHSIPMQNNASMMRNVSNSGLQEMPSQTQTSTFKQTPLVQQVQQQGQNVAQGQTFQAQGVPQGQNMPQSQNLQSSMPQGPNVQQGQNLQQAQSLPQGQNAQPTQSVQHGQGQGMPQGQNIDSKGPVQPSYGHPQQGQIHIQPQQGIQNPGQLQDNLGQATTPFGQQAQSHMHLSQPPTGQGLQLPGNASHVGGNYQNASGDGQGQQPLNQYPGIQQQSIPNPLQQNGNGQQGIQQGSSQQGQVMAQGGQNQTFGQVMGHQHQGGGGQVTSQQGSMGNQNFQAPSHAAQPGQQASSNLAPNAQQVVSAAAPSNQGSTIEPTNVTTNVSAQSRPVGSEENSVPATATNEARVSSGMPVSVESQINGARGVPSMDVASGTGVDDMEMRKLDIEFEKSVMRTKKVFESRMDNLQRTQVQKEAQHQRTLVKHQKERADFEKRRQQEEIEQNRRIGQMREEWENQREAIRQRQMAESASDTGSLGSNLADQSEGKAVVNPTGGSGTER